MKLCSSAAFLILRPQGLQTRCDKFSFLVYNSNPIEPQQWAKISLAISTLPDSKNKFSNETRPPPEMKLTPQNLQLLFFWNVYIGFPFPFTIFCLRACLFGGGGAQVGEVTRLSIQSLILMWSRWHVRWGNPPHVTSPTWGPPPSCKQALSRRHSVAKIFSCFRQ